MKLRVLLAESDTEDVLFLRDVLEEMEGSEYWTGWLHLDISDAPSWTFAEALLNTEPTDIILLSLNLDDVRGAEVFRRTQALAPHVPVVLMIEEADLETAEHLMREGAQDFLIKKHVDCAPLAHAMRNALMRHRVLSAARAAAMTDPLTGLLNRAAFQILADRDRRLAERAGTRTAILVAEPKNLVTLRTSYGEQHRDLALVEAADRLRGFVGPLDVTARISMERFAISVVETRAETIGETCQRYRASAEQSGLRLAAAIFNPESPATLDSLIDQAESGLIRMPPARMGTAQSASSVG